MKFITKNTFKIFQIPFWVTKRGQKQIIFEDSKSITPQLSNASSTVLLCVLYRKLSVVVSRLSVSKKVTFEENKPFFTTKIDFFNLLCVIMGWSLSSLDWLMGAVSTLKPNLNIRGSF